MTGIAASEAELAMTERGHSKEDQDSVVSSSRKKSFGHTGRNKELQAAASWRLAGIGANNLVLPVHVGKYAQKQFVAFIEKFSESFRCFLFGLSYSISTFGIFLWPPFSAKV